MTGIYQVYSDASRRAAVGIAIRIVRDGTVVGEGSAKTNCKDSLSGELTGHCEALAMTPVGSKCILYHDLDCLPRMLDGTAKEFTKYGEVLARLRALIFEREVALKRADGPHYQHCHIASRRAAGKKLRPIGRPPPYPGVGSAIGATKEEIAEWAKRHIAWRERKKF